MTTLIIKSNSDEKTNLLLQFAQELGLSAVTKNYHELEATDMIKGIGRKATDDELTDYLSKDPGIPVSLEKSFAKYLNKE